MVVVESEMLTSSFNLALILNTPLGRSLMVLKLEPTNIITRTTRERGTWSEMRKSSTATETVDRFIDKPLRLLAKWLGPGGSYVRYVYALALDSNRSPSSDTSDATGQ